LLLKQNDLKTNENVKKSLMRRVYRCRR